jgi:hypothetical protein
MRNTMTNILVSNTKDVLGDEWSRRRGEAMVVVRKREAKALFVWRRGGFVVICVWVIR